MSADTDEVYNSSNNEGTSTTKTAVTSPQSSSFRIRPVGSSEGIEPAEAFEEAPSSPFASDDPDSPSTSATSPTVMGVTITPATPRAEDIPHILNQGGTPNERPKKVKRRSHAKLPSNLTPEEPQGDDNTASQGTVLEYGTKAEEVHRRESSSREFARFATPPLLQALP